MQRWQWLVGISISAGAAITACGSSTSDNNNNNTADSGSDTGVVGDTSVPDTAPVADSAPAADTAPAPPPCVPDGSVNINTLNIPDAGLGTSSVGLCIACAQAKCATNVTACNGDCKCLTDLPTFFTCLASGSSAITCATPLALGADSVETAAGLCIYGGCTPECNFPHDGGAPPADGSTDAADAGG